jgi:hypothetical protein
MIAGAIPTCNVFCVRDAPNKTPYCEYPHVGWWEVSIIKRADHWRAFFHRNIHESSLTTSPQPPHHPHETAYPRGETRN